MVSRSTNRRVWASSAVAALLLGYLVSGAAPASARPFDCKQDFVTSSVTGHTQNRTKLPLTRTGIEKGITNSWGDEPATALKPHELDVWCVYAQGFGAAMKVNYALPDGTTAFYEAWRYQFGSGARCDVLGPSAADYRCHARGWAHPEGGRDADARFDLIPVR
jgi:hypothetical protein